MPKSKTAKIVAELEKLSGRKFKPIDIERIPCKEFSERAVLVKNPIVSVNMLTYNHELYIAKAIEGVVNQQTQYPFELIIGEDCSADRTREIVLAFQEKHPHIIRVITSDKNVGVIRNRLRVEKVSRGKYVAYHDGDDFWHRMDKLQIQVSYLEAHPEVGLIHSDADVHMVESGKHISSSFKNRNVFPDQKNVLSRLIVKDFNIRTSSVVLRRDLISEITKTCKLEFSELFMMDDTQRWIEITKRSEVKFCNLSLVTYNFLPVSECRFRDLEKNIRYLKNCLYVSLYYSEKYGGGKERQMKARIINRYGRMLLARYCQNQSVGNQSVELAEYVRELCREHRVVLKPSCFIYYLAAQNGCCRLVVRIIFAPLERISRGLLLVARKADWILFRKKHWAAEDWLFSQKS